MIDKQLLRKRFSKQAITYDEYAQVQKKMANQLIEQLNHNRINDSEHLSILEIGCGTGYLTSLLSRKFPFAQITAVDLAPGMIEQAAKKLSARNIEFLCKDIEEYSLLHQYDLIISNATFQWFNQLDQTIKKLSLSLKDQGMLCFSTFGKRTFQELHDSYERARQTLHLQQSARLGQSFFSLEKLSDLCSFSLNDLDIPFTFKAEEYDVFEYFSSVHDFFQSIKKVGANNSNKDTYIQHPSLFKQLIREYENTYTERKGVKATYHCMNFCIKRV